MISTCSEVSEVLWHDGIGMSLYAKRLEKGRFIWPSPTVALSTSRLPNSPTRSTESIGGTRFIPSDRSAQDSRRPLHF